MDIKQSYDNAYKLFIGEINYDDLGDKFWLPINHESQKVILDYYEEKEDYERCQQIINV